MWALTGLILTIGGTFLEAFVTNAPWNWVPNGVQTQSLDVSFQVGAVMLVGCLGGRNAAAIAQIAYLLIGLVGFNVFTQGGGLDYIHQPSFGYLLGFIPGAWICGSLAFRFPPRLETLALSCLVGLMTIHLVGLGYLWLASQGNGWLIADNIDFTPLAITYSLQTLPRQMAVICATTLIAYILRHLMFY
jgi:biotin transport system substrate-specific component